MLQDKKTVKLIVLFSVMGLIVISALVFKTMRKPPSIHKTAKIYDLFKLEKVSIKSYNDRGLFLTLKADKIVHRDRTAKFFRYHNLKELYFTNVELEIFPDGSFSLSDGFFSDEVGKGLVRNVGNILLKDDDNLRTGDGPNPDLSETVANPDYKIITRAIIDDLFIALHNKNGPLVKISSGNAVINFESRNIEFKRNFSIMDANNKTITAPEAVWTYKSNLVCFPRGYTSYPFRHQKQASFSLDASGRLIKTRYPAADAFAKDRISEIEEALTTKYIAPYVNTFYASLLTKGKFDPSIFKTHAQPAKEREQNIHPTSLNGKP